MDIANMNMKEEFIHYNEIAPIKTTLIFGKEFQYRYYHNRNPKENMTIVMLAGGSGMADGFYPLAKSFMENYSFITFNYPIAFKGNEETADAIAELLKSLSAENVYLWGQSYGGILAQIIAKRHPDVVQGLILTSTASLSNDIQFEGMKCLTSMLSEEKEQKRYKMYKNFPMFLLPVMMNLAFKKHLKDRPGAYKAVKDLMKELRPAMSKEYFIHMTSLLADLRSHFGSHHQGDFDFLEGRVLIIEPDDDKTFTCDVKEALFHMMKNPKIIKKIEGGHLAIMFNPDHYMSHITAFMNEQSEIIRRECN